MDKKVIYSAVQPTHCLTLGNYIGALNNWLQYQNEPNNDCIFAIADLHALTVRQEPNAYRERCLSLFAQYLAMGLDCNKSILYFQSQVHQHTELQWILNCYTYVGEMNRMTQFKDKSAKHADNINMGLMDYPVLMASDILLYDSNYVPVGIDQMQHIEITRDIAIRFNNIYGDIFTVPEGKLGKIGAKIMSLADPTAKMSKSDPDANATINVLDEEGVIMKKFKKAVTDSDSNIAYDHENKPGVSNLISILAAATGKSITEVVADCEGLMYGHLKVRTGEAVAAMLKPVRDNYNQLMQNKDYLYKLAEDGRARAHARAAATMERVKDAVGLIPRKKF
ncbi:MAG: tryptophan--tRNA ligase [Clostridia bacterium]|nr:tryptophan--tRNA ligase [Clostridia bacterium]